LAVLQQRKALAVLRSFADGNSMTHSKAELLKALSIGAACLLLFIVGTWKQGYIGFETRFALFAREMFAHGRSAGSCSARRTHLRSDSAVQPTFPAIEFIPDHCESYSARKHSRATNVAALRRCNRVCICLEA
jgi:hypothetical protein